MIKKLLLILLLIPSYLFAWEMEKFTISDFTGAYMDTHAEWTAGDPTFMYFPFAEIQWDCPANTRTALANYVVVWNVVTDTFVSKYELPAHDGNVYEIKQATDPNLMYVSAPYGFKAIFIYNKALNTATKHMDGGSGLFAGINGAKMIVEDIDPTAGYHDVVWCTGNSAVRSVTRWDASDPDNESKLLVLDFYDDIGFSYGIAKVPTGDINTIYVAGYGGAMVSFPSDIVADNDPRVQVIDLNNHVMVGHPVTLTSIDYDGQHIYGALSNDDCSVGETDECVGFFKYLPSSTIGEAGELVGVSWSDAAITGVIPDVKNIGNQVFLETEETNGASYPPQPCEYQDGDKSLAQLVVMDKTTLKTAKVLIEIRNDDDKAVSSMSVTDTHVYLHGLGHSVTKAESYAFNFVKLTPQLLSGVHISGANATGFEIY